MYLTNFCSHRPWLFRMILMVIALQLLVPFVPGTDADLGCYEECSEGKVPTGAEEVLKHVDEVVISSPSLEFSHRMSVFLASFEDSMLDHPVLEVPHQPPKLS